MFRNIQSAKRRVLNEVGITECQVCGESRALDFCHIVAEKEGGLIEATNCLVMCPTHHRLFDNGLLYPAEYRKIAKYVAAARRRYSD